MLSGVVFDWSGFGVGTRVGGNLSALALEGIHLKQALAVVVVAVFRLVPISTRSRRKEANAELAQRFPSQPLYQRQIASFMTHPRRPYSFLLALDFPFFPPPCPIVASSRPPRRRNAFAPARSGVMGRSSMNSSLGSRVPRVSEAFVGIAMVVVLVMVSRRR